MAIPVTFFRDKYAKDKKPTSNPREIPEGNLKAYQPFNTSQV